MEKADILWVVLFSALWLLEWIYLSDIVVGISFHVHAWTEPGKQLNNVHLYSHVIAAVRNNLHQVTGEKSKKKQNKKKNNKEKEEEVLLFHFCVMCSHF